MFTRWGGSVLPAWQAAQVNSATVERLSVIAERSHPGERPQQVYDASTELAFLTLTILTRPSDAATNVVK
jgi:hypothetical protein